MKDYKASEETYVWAHQPFHTLTNGESEGGMEWYRSKNSCKVEESKKAADERKFKQRKFNFQYLNRTYNEKHDFLWTFLFKNSHFLIWQMYALVCMNQNYYDVVSAWSSPDLQLVGIWTVHRSSEDSSVDVPMKSKLRQLWASLRSCMSSPCWLSSFRFKFFPDA